MPRTRRPGGYCNTATAQGTTCMVHTGGGACYLHRNGPVDATPRCGAPIGSGRCFKRVAVAGELCRHHQPPTGHDPVEVNAWLRRLRKQLQGQLATLDELIKRTEG